MAEVSNPYVGLTKGEFVATLADVSDDTPLYVFVDGTCSGYAKIDSVAYLAGDDAEYADVPNGIVVVDADTDGAREPGDFLAWPE